MPSPRGVGMARFTAEFLDAVRDRVPLVDLVGSIVKLKRSGREWTGLCPFHKEKTPSFMVNAERGHCFGCGWHGGHYDFVMQQYGYDFPDAVRWLAGRAGLKVPDDTPADREAEARRARIYTTLEQAQRHYQASLNREHRDYLAQRGVMSQEIADWGIGFAAKGLKGSRDDLLAAGLAKEDDQGNLRQRFWNRITLPIRDRQGRIIAFGGRIWGDGKPKYLNSPETAVFTKSRTLFGLEKLAHPVESLLVVEGQFDTISASRALPTLGTMGTALSAEHCRTLWRLCAAPVLCFDGDAAGRRAALSAIETAFTVIEPGRTLRFALLPDGDPDELVRKGGVEALGSLVAAADGLADTFWRLSTDGRSTASPDDLAAIEAAMLARVRTIRHDGLRERYVQDVRSRVRRQPRQGNPGIVRSNGNTNHSACPGAFKLSRGIDVAAFTLREAALIAEVAAAPLSADVERIAAMSLSARAHATIAEIVRAASDGRDASGSDIAEARELLQSVGISA